MRIMPMVEKKVFDGWLDGLAVLCYCVINEVKITSGQGGCLKTPRLSSYPQHLFFFVKIVMLFSLGQYSKPLKFDVKSFII